MNEFIELGGKTHFRETGHFSDYATVSLGIVP